MCQEVLAVRSRANADPADFPVHLRKEGILAVPRFELGDDVFSRPAPTIATEVRDSLVACIAVSEFDAGDLNGDRASLSRNHCVESPSRDECFVVVSDRKFRVWSLWMSGKAEGTAVVVLINH